MAIGGPTCRYAPLFHDHEAMCIRKCERLIGNLFDYTAGLGYVGCSEPLDPQGGQLLDKPQELDCSLVVVPAKKPAMSFGNYQSRGQQRRRFGEQLPKKRMVGIGPIEECNERR